MSFHYVSLKASACVYYNTTRQLNNCISFLQNLTRFNLHLERANYTKDCPGQCIAEGSKGLRLEPNSNMFNSSFEGVYRASLSTCRDRYEERTFIEQLNRKSIKARLVQLIA